MCLFCIEIADLANCYKDLLSADCNAQYDEVIEINLDTVTHLQCLFKHHCVCVANGYFQGNVLDEVTVQWVCA